MQVDQGVRVPGAVRGLVEPHGPAAHPLARLADQPGGRTQVVLGDTGELRDGGGRVVGQELPHRLPARGVRGDELGVGVPVLDQQVQQPVQKGEVGPRLDLEEQVGLRGRGGAPRIDDDELRPRLDPLHHPQEEDRMAVGHVRTDDEEDIRPVEVLVRTGRPVGTERQLVTGPALAMHNRELDSIWLVRTNPLASLFARYCASRLSCPET